MASPSVLAVRGSALSPVPLSTLPSRELNSQAFPQCYCSRRFIWSFAAAIAAPATTLLPLPLPALARDRRNKKDIPIDEYQTNSKRLSFFFFLSIFMYFFLLAVIAMIRRALFMRNLFLRFQLIKLPTIRHSYIDQVHAKIPPFLSVYQNTL